MYAFSGVAAVGHRANAFNHLDFAIPLHVLQVLPMELAIRDSYTSMSTMTIGSLGDWLNGGT